MLADVIRRLFRANNNVSGDDYGLLFRADLQTTLRPQKANGSNAPTFTRATTAYVEDFEGLLKPVLSGEARFEGARRVYNYLAGTASATPTEDISAAAWTRGTGVTASDASTLVYAGGGSAGGQRLASGGIGGRTGQFRASFEARWVVPPAGTNDVQVRCNAVGSYDTITLTTSWRRYAGSVTTIAAGTLFFDISSAAGNNDTFTLQVRKILVEDVTGQSNQNPSEYVSVGVLSAPYHGAGVDGVKYFSTKNGNTVSSNVVTEAMGDPIDADDYFADARGPYGYFAEGARTNLCLQSQTLGTTWTASDLSISANTDVAPDGTTTMDRLVEAATTAAHYIRQSITFTNAVHVVSVYAKAGSAGRYIALFCGGAGSGGGGAAAHVVFNPADGTVSEKGSEWTSAGVEVLPGGIYRFYAVATMLAGAANLDVRLANAGTTAAANTGYAGDGTSYVPAWGVQVELGSFPSSYIPTTTAAVTRNAELETYAAAGNIKAPCTVVFELPAGVPASSANQWTFDAYTNDDNRAGAYVDTSGHAVLYVQSGGVNVASVTGTTDLRDTPCKIAVVIADNDFRLYVNGAAEGTPDTSGSAPAFTTLAIGSYGISGGFELNAPIRGFKAYGRALSAARCQQESAL